MASLPPSVHPAIKLDSKLGAAFLGCLFASIFYGITCVQAFIFYQKNHKDRPAFRILIFFLWVIDTVHLALIAHSLYFYLVSSYGNLLSLISPTWSVLGQVYLTCISDVIIRGIFGRRVWLMAGRNYILALCITLTSLTTFITGFAFATRAFAVKTFENLHLISYYLYASLASGVVADLFIAGSLCFLLSKSRTGFRKTDSLVNILMMYSINTSLLTTICSAACFITYTIWPSEFTFIGIYFSLSKLYLNSLLATLNGREALQDKINGVSDIAMSDISSRRVDLSSMGSSRHGPSLIVSINKEVVSENYEKRKGDSDRARAV